MLFTTTNLFKGIACPERDNCRLTNCIYSHETPQTSATPAPQPQPAAAAPPSRPSEGGEPATKRRKITYDSLADKPPSRADIIRNQLAAARPSSTQSRPSPSSTSQTSIHGSAQAPRTLVKPVSPPQTANRAVPPSQTFGKPAPPSNSSSEAAANKTPTPDLKVETLNPRLVPNDPLGHAKRSLLIKHLHGEMVRLNTQVREMGVLDRMLYFTGQELIKLALDEEEKIVREQPKVYPNVIKQRIMAYKKMSVDQWKEKVKSAREVLEVQSWNAQQSSNPQNSSNHQQKRAPDKEKPIVTGLPLHEEALILPHLVVDDQSTLRSFGYIPTPPTAADASTAAAAVTASRNYEECDRCSARFQVFPDRNPETGLLTGGGHCKFHPNRPIQPPKAHKGEASKAKIYPCCNETIGTPGCAESEEHVFKTSSPARLAAVCPFITTPENDSPRRCPKTGKKVEAVVFDCEMGYTSLGLELIRLTALSWPKGVELVDVLVRPLGAIIDLNSRFSGVYAEDFSKNTTPVVNGPEEARKAMCAFLTPNTPLMGHAIDNDLNTVRLCHPTIVDTVILFAHPRGLPMRFGLKMLSQRHLGRSIQSGVGGHDSKEDARATGDLVRVKVGERWKSMKIAGWKIEDGKLVEPEKKIEDPAWAEGGGKRKLAELLEEESGGEEGPSEQVK